MISFKPESEEEINERRKEKVNHPDHYAWLKEVCGIEPIDICRHLSFNLGNVLKYIIRAGRKTESGYSCREKKLEDLRKAAFYLLDEIEMTEKGGTL